MTQPEIEPRSLGPLANTLPTRPMSRSRWRHVKKKKATDKNWSSSVKSLIESLRVLYIGNLWNNQRSSDNMSKIIKCVVLNFYWIYFQKISSFAGWEWKYSSQRWATQARRPNFTSKYISLLSSLENLNCLLLCMAKSTGAAEYTNEHPGYDTKQSDSEAPAVMELG